jgi:hypothetical protein
VVPGQSTFFLSDIADPYAGTKFVYTTDRCERVHLFAQVTQYPPWIPVLYVQYSFDEPVPTPELAYLASTASWFDMFSAPFTVCPSTPGGTMSIYISVAPLSLPPGLQAELQFTLETVWMHVRWINLLDAHLVCVGCLRIHVCMYVAVLIIIRKTTHGGWFRITSCQIGSYGDGGAARWRSTVTAV